MKRSGMTAFRPAGLRVLITVLVLIQLLPPTSSRKNNPHYCAPSSCGNIPNISYPFRLKGDPPNCGDQRYEFSCDDNNHTLFSFNDGSKYYVSQINYNNYTIRIVDAGIQKNNYSFIPRYFINYGNFTGPNWDLDRYYSNVVVIVNCGKPATPTFSSNFRATLLNCNSNIKNGSGSSSNSSLSQYSKRYIYHGATVMAVEESCTIEQMSLTTYRGFYDNIYDNISCTDLRNVFSYGFELSWYPLYCGSCPYDSCYFRHYDNQVHCYGQFSIFLRGLTYAAFVPASYTVFWATRGRFIPLGYRESPFFFVIEVIIGLLFDWHVAITVLGTPFVIAFFIYKWRRRHLSMYNGVEEFLQSQNNQVYKCYSPQHLLNPHVVW